MNEWLSSITDILTYERVAALVRALIILAVGIILAKLAGVGIKQLLAKRLDRHRLMLVQRAGYYLVFVLFLISALRELGFSLGVLLGAAGIISVAIGFASQTSASNLISGLFLIGERPFAVGDLIQVGQTIGKVISIDLLSVKLRTYDNLYVRIPNEMLIKSEFTTLTKFPIRRIDLQVGVAYKEDITRVREVLFDTADRNPLCLEEPGPLCIFRGFGDSSIDLQFSVWTKTENYLHLLNSIQEEIKSAFDTQGIEIPFPHRTLYTGSVTEPFPVRVVEESNRDKAARA